VIKVNKDLNLSFLFVGSIVPHKNVDELVKVFEIINKKFPKTKLNIVGHADKKEFEKLNLLSKQNIEYFGYLSDAKLVSMYKKIDICITLSKSEGFCLPIYEGLNFGKPFIVSNGIIHKEIEAYGIQVNSHLNVTDKAQFIIDNLTKLLEIKKQISVQKIRSHFSWQTMTQKIIEGGQNNKIYYFIDNTSKVEINSGIQKTTKEICKSFINSQYLVHPISLNSLQEIITTKDSDLDRFQKNDGPSKYDFNLETKLKFDESSKLAKDVLVIPELLTYLNVEEINNLFENLKQYNIKILYIIYDILPVVRKQDYNNEVIERFNFLMLKVIEYADIGLCISNYVLEQFKSYYKHQLQKSRIKLHTIPLGYSNNFSEIKNNKNESKLINDIKLFLKNSELTLFYPATIEPRKNHVKLVKVIRKLNQKYSSKLKLVCVGWNAYPDIYNEIVSLIDENFLFLENVNNDIVKFMFESTDYTIYPSLDEGFGLPIIESLGMKTKVICSNFGSMKEIQEKYSEFCFGIDSRSENNFYKDLENIIFTSGIVIKPSKIIEKLEINDWKFTVKEIENSLDD